jgi:hypothetical protein
MAHLLTSPISLRLFEVFGVATDDPVPDERLIQSRLGCHHGEWCYFDASALREASAMLDRAGLAGQW